MSENLLKFQLSGSFPKFNLDCSGEIVPGTTGVFGPSASGKSSLAKALLGFYPQIKGKVQLGGKVWQDSKANIWLAPHKRGIGYVPQQSLLYPHLSVRENITTGAKGRKPSKIKWDFQKICGDFQLEGLLSKYPRELSGGERQRVALGRCLLSQPEVLIMDEPFASLDHSYRFALVDKLAELLKEYNLPAMYISHSPSEMARLCPTMYLMETGRLKAKGNSLQLLNGLEENPGAVRKNYLRGYLQQEKEGPLFLRSPGNKLRLQLSPFGGYAKFLNEQKLFLAAIPARDVIVATSFPNGISARNILSAKIEKTSTHTYGVLVKCQLEEEEWEICVELTFAAASELQIKPGAEVFLIIKAHSITAGE